MKPIPFFLAIALLPIFQGCNSINEAPGPPRVSEADVVGEWSAKLSMSDELHSLLSEAVADNLTGQDLLKLVPTTQFSIELKSDKTFSLAALFIFEFPGTWTLDGEEVRLEFDEIDDEQMPEALKSLFDGAFLLSVSQDKLSMSGPSNGDPETVLVLEKVMDEEVDDEE